MDTTGNFKISEETVAVNPQTGKGEAYVNALERSLGAYPIRDTSFLLYKRILQIAFEEHADKLCVPRQIAYITDQPIGQVTIDLEARACEGVDIETHGTPGAMIFQYARKHGFGAVCVHNNIVVEKLACEPHVKMLAFLVHADHSYFYDQKASRLLLNG